MKIKSITIILLITLVTVAIAHPINYLTFPETVAKLVQFETDYPELCKLESIGKSTQGRELWALKVSDLAQVDENEPAVTLNATIHGNESIANEVSLKLIDYLLQEYKTGNPEIVKLINNTELYFLPIINPDGMVITKRENANNIDLNRSFPDGVENDIQNIFDQPNFSTTGRQAETAALMRWHATKNFALSSCLHSGTVLIVYPYGNNLTNTDTYSPSPDDNLFIEISTKYIDGNPNMNTTHIKNGAVMYPITGEMADWKYRFLGTLATTIELSNVKEPIDITTVWNNHKQALINYLSTALQGLHGTVLDASTGEVVRAKLRLKNSSGHDFYTGQDGYFNRILLVGQYQIEIVADGYKTKTIQVTISEDQLNLQHILLEPITQTTSVNIGWNQLSLAWPLTESIGDELLPSQELVWTWDGTNYQQTKLPAPGIAFWLHSNTSRQILLNDKPTEYNFTPPTLNLGWNLIGSPSFDTVDHFSTYTWAWHWQASDYKLSTTLKRWQGYWIFSF